MDGSPALFRCNSVKKKWQHRTGLPVKKLNLHIHDVLVSRHKFVTHLDTHLQRNG